MKKKILLVALSLMLMMQCFGCKGPSDEDKATLRVIAHSQMQDYLDPFFEGFTEATGIKVNPLYGVDQITELDSELPPDLLFTGNVQLPGIAHLFEDLNVLLEGELGSSAEIQKFRSQFLGSTLDFCTVEDRLLILPTMMNVSLLYYNKDLFDAAGIAYPTDNWTYSDYVNYGKQLTKKDSTGRYTQWGATTTEGWWGEFLIYVRQFGGDFYKADGSLAINTPEFKRGIQFFKDKAVGENKFAPNPGSTAVGEGTLGGFMGRATAMDFGGHTGNWPSFNALSDLNWDVEVLPTPDGMPDARGAEIAVEGWGIAKASLNKEAAMKLLMYLYTEEGIEAISAAGKLVPTVGYRDKTLATPKEDRQNPKNMEAVFKAIDKAMPLPTEPYFEGSAGTPIYNTIAQYLNGGYENIDQWAIAAEKAVNDYVRTQG